MGTDGREDGSDEENDASFTHQIHLLTVPVAAAATAADR